MRGNFSQMMDIPGFDLRQRGQHVSYRISGFKACVVSGFKAYVIV
jgi:hypothetical protein